MPLIESLRAPKANSRLNLLPLLTVHSHATVRRRIRPWPSETVRVNICGSTMYICSKGTETRCIEHMQHIALWLYCTVWTPVATKSRLSHRSEPPDSESESDFPNLNPYCTRTASASVHHTHTRPPFAFLHGNETTFHPITRRNRGSPPLLSLRRSRRRQDFHRQLWHVPAQLIP
jgi:hypothetical protein